MLSTDRTEFEIQLDRLCSGFNVPMSEARKEAYWTGLAKMSLSQFSRSIDHALSEDGPDKIPTTGQIWRIHKQARASGAAQPVHTSAAKEDPDHLEYFANRLLMQHLSHRGGLGTPAKFVSGVGVTQTAPCAELTACLTFKRQLVRDWCGFIREGDELAKPREFLSQWVKGLKRIGRIEEKTLEELRVFAKHPTSRVPFPLHMARELTPRQPSLLEHA